MSDREHTTKSPGSNIMVDHPRRAAVFARTNSAHLCNSLRTVDALPSTPETRQVRLWLIDELERRHPAASEAVGHTIEQAELDERTSGTPVEVDHVDVLVTAIDNELRPSEPSLDQIRAKVTALPSGDITEHDLARIGVTPEQFSRLADDDIDREDAAWHGPVIEPDEVLPPDQPCPTCDDAGGCGDGCCECPDCGQL